METSPPRKWDTWRTPEELIADGLPIARFVARRFAGRGEAEEDLVQVAMIGLVKAARRFDPTLGNQFVSYATATIVGELKRHFRDHRWGMHVGRSAQERYLLVRQAAEWATTATGRAPTVDEIAKQAGLSVEDVIEAQHLATAMHLDSLESPAPSSTARIGNERSVGVVDARFDRVNDRMCLQRILPGLAKREREILWLRFVEERSQSEIAARLGMSQMHVSRILSRTLRALRLQLSADSPDQAEIDDRSDDVSNAAVAAARRPTA